MIRRPPRSTLFPYTTLFRSLVVLGDGFEQVVAPLPGCLGVVGGDVGDLVGLALPLALPEQPAHPDQVDDAAEIGLDAPRQLNDQRRGTEPVPDHLHPTVELGPD